MVFPMPICYVKSCTQVALVMVMADLHSNTLLFDPIFGGDQAYYVHSLLLTSFCLLINSSWLKEEVKSLVTTEA